MTSGKGSIGVDTAVSFLRVSWFIDIRFILTMSISGVKRNPPFPVE